MNQRDSLLNSIFSEHSDASFESLALDMFRYQVMQNPVYAQWLDALRISPERVQHLQQIPFMPITFFKTHRVVTEGQEHVLRFESSGTTGSATSVHYICNPSVYEKSILEGFKRVFGNPCDWVFLALLPSYLERSNSSLVYMIKTLMEASGQPENGFYLHNYQELILRLEELKKQNKNVWLIGVSYALLDLAQLRPPAWKNLLVLETGGMKGRRKEMVREELHAEILKYWSLKKVYSEYGMTELLSQAWLGSDGYFTAPPWMKILIRDPDDPFSVLAPGQKGGIQIIDLANIDSCAFISTFDLGKLLPDGRFEVNGRFDNADLRGCNLLSDI